jgi:branched-chain amino acid transport system ATP-binding protein
MLTLERVTAGYGKVAILHDVSIRVNPGEVVTILGANGGGKTTLLYAIAGLIPVSGGTIQYEGRDITALPAHAVVSCGITMVPEARRLFPHMTVKDNLLLGAYTPKARADSAKRLEEVLDLFPRVAERLLFQAKTLSGGEQQMVAIARGLMADPSLMMFDEPSLGLSPVLVRQVFEIIDTIARSGRTVLLVEQNVFHTLQIAHRGYVLENGRITMEDTASRMLTNPDIKKAFLGI